ncbi:hypothetical protein MHYP_G00167090 [Metynnis hypsauchen]
MTEAVDRLRLLQFVLIQALLLTVCSSESDKNYVRCQNVTGTVGKPLTLTCKITSGPNCSCLLCKWIKNGIELKYDTDCKPNSTLNYPIQNPSMEDNGTFTLWVQLRCGPIEGHLSVILSEDVNHTPREEINPTPRVNILLTIHHSIMEEDIYDFLESGQVAHKQIYQLKDDTVMSVEIWTPRNRKFLTSSPDGNTDPLTLAFHTTFEDLEIQFGNVHDDNSSDLLSTISWHSQNEEAVLND